MSTGHPQHREAYERTLASARAHPWRVAAAVFAIALLVLVLLWDWNWFKGPVERVVSAQTGRSFEIGGDLDVDLGPTTIVRADRLVLGNADWSGTPEMAKADSLELHVRPFSLLTGSIHIPELGLSRPDLLLETGDDGGNWIFEGMSGDGEGPRIDRLLVDEGRLRFIDRAGETDIDLAVASHEGADAGERPLTLHGDGHWRGEAFELSGAVASPLELRSTDTPFALDLR